MRLCLMGDIVRIRACLSAKRYGGLRCLKQGRVLWYAPDQDYGAEHSVFVPFFGNLAATITAGSRFAKFNESPVVFFSHYRRPTTPDTTFISAKC